MIKNDIMKLILLKISIIKTAFRVLTGLCIFLPAFLSLFLTNIPNWMGYFSFACLVFLVIQSYLIPRYEISGKIQIEEKGIIIQTQENSVMYRLSDIKRIDIEYKGYKGGGDDKPHPIFLPLITQDGIGTFYIETVQPNRKDWLHFLSGKNIKKELLTTQSLFWSLGVDFRLIM